MDADISKRLSYKLKKLENARAVYESRIDLLGRNCNETLRVSQRRNGRKYYSSHVKGEKRDIYLGSDDNAEVVRIREIHFLREALRRIDKDIALIKALINDYQPYAPEYVNDALPQIYRIKLAPVSKLYAAKGDAWLRDRLAFQKRFKENYPENKQYTTSDGVMIKTLSELFIYEKFKEAGLFLIYELPVPMSDYGPPLYPDFTVLSPLDMRTEIIVEYVGRLDSPKYREDFAKKVGRYISSGYIPGVNLFFIFSDADGHIDLAQVDKVITDICGR